MAVPRLSERIARKLREKHGLEERDARRGASVLHALATGNPVAMIYPVNQFFDDKPIPSQDETLLNRRAQMRNLYGKYPANSVLREELGHYKREGENRRDSPKRFTHRSIEPLFKEGLVEFDVGGYLAEKTYRNATVQQTVTTHRPFAETLKGEPRIADVTQRKWLPFIALTEKGKSLLSEVEKANRDFSRSGKGKIANLRGRISGIARRLRIK